MELESRCHDELAEALTAGAGDVAFAYVDTADAGDLSIAVEGVGLLTWPVTRTQARSLRAVANLARYGRGEETLLDREVRDTWVIPKSRVKLDGRRWRKTLGPQLKKIHAALGLPPGTRLRSKLHDMLMYERGQFFHAHQDTEKTDAMVATLVVLLPSHFEGGESIVEHGGEQMMLAGGSRSKVSFLAFFADCRHRVRQVTRGQRVALTYALELVGKPEAIEVSVGTRQRVASIVEEHFATEAMMTYRGDRALPDRLVYLLDHEYTPRSLGWAKLKGRDVQTAAALRQVAQDGDHDVFLATAQVHETWMCESEGYRSHGYGRSGYRQTVGEGEHPPLIEQHDEEVVLDDWVDGDGQATGEAASPVLPGELAYATPNDDCTPFEVEHEGYMGNYGDTVDRWYHRAAIVLRPRSRAFIARAKRDGLYALATIAETARTDRTEALALARQMLPYWKPNLVHGLPGEDVLGLAVALEDSEVAAEWLAPLALERVAPHGRWLTPLAETYGEDWVGERVAEWLGEARPECRWRLAPGARAAWIGALQGLASEWGSASSERRALVGEWIHAQWVWLAAHRKGAAEAMDQTTRAALLERLRPSVVELARAAHGAHARATLTAMAESLGSLDAALADDAALLATLRQELGEGYQRWFAQAESRVREVLDIELARPPRASDDWSVPAEWTCRRCDLCGPLQAFLRDPSQRVLEWKIAKHGRQHLHETIDRRGLPVRHQTRREGRPHTLVLTKTDEVFTRDQEKRTQWRAARALVGPRD